MINNDTSVLPAANNITVLTRLSSCDNQSFDLNRTVHDLYNLYRNNLSNVFLNVSINYFTCRKEVESYFEQVITFTQAVSIQIQILLASIYSEYINTNNYQFNGLIINQQTYFTLSSITTHNNALSDACSTADIAHDSFCSKNLTYPICTVLSNRWNYICSSVTMNNTSITSGLSTWQLGLICSLSILFVIILFVVFGYFYRRYARSKQIALSRLNLYDTLNFTQKAGIPQSEEFKRATTIIQPLPNNNTTISWIHKDSMKKVIRKNEHSAKTKPLEMYNQGTSNDLSGTITQNSLVSKNISRNVPNSTVFTNIPIIIISGSTSEKKLNQSRLTTDESDSSSLNQSNLNDSRTPLTKLSTHMSLPDENLNDEDAWMSILDVVNAELAILNEQDQIRVSM
ncbi:hypothetical protein I4U23_017751 [Adineta vaga]|nr:hypothetical protein I4U23_017751 [Adineta vaga]